MSSVSSHKLPENPLVSVSIITYNHKDYIAEAIESVLKQEVDFKYEIIIGDDFSGDGTQEILKHYQQKYQDKIQLILHPRDYDCVPGRVNNITNLYACRGKYIAMLDGDDVWVSRNKLQKQVSFLEKNEDFSLSFHEALLCFSDGREVLSSLGFSNYEKGTKSVFSFNDVLTGWFIQTSTILFRNRLIGEFPDWFWEIYSADYAIQLLIAKHGKLKYFPDIISKRNYHRNSFSATQNTTIAHLRRRKQEQVILGKIFPGYSDYRNYSFAKGKFSEARGHLKKRKPRSFLLDISRSIFYSGRFLIGHKISFAKKIELIKRDLSNRISD
ncbi:MAG: glycosyltransferase [Leeuwenhoekiella sp.]